MSLEQDLRLLVGVWLEADQYCQHVQHGFGGMFGTSKVFKSCVMWIHSACDKGLSTGYVSTPCLCKFMLTLSI